MNTSMTQGSSNGNGIYYPAPNTQLGPMQQPQPRAGQSQHPLTINNPSLALRRPTADQGMENLTPLDMENLMGHLPSANSPLGSAPSPSPEMVSTPTSDYDQWETPSQNAHDSWIRSQPVNFVGTNTLHPNAIHPDPSSLFASGSPGGSPTGSGAGSGGAETHLAAGASSLSRSNSRSRANSKTGQSDLLGPGPVRTEPGANLRRVKSDTASAYTTTSRARSRARSTASGQPPGYPGSGNGTGTGGYGSGSPSEPGFPGGGDFMDPDEKRRQIEKKSREKRLAALGTLKQSLGELMNMSFQDRNQAEVFDAASALLKQQSSQIRELDRKVKDLEELFNTASRIGDSMHP